MAFEHIQRSKDALDGVFSVLTGCGPQEIDLAWAPNKTELIDLRHFDLTLFLFFEQKDEWTIKILNIGLLTIFLERECIIHIFYFLFCSSKDSL